jgi:DNA-binding transcriptional ArsR family regulator
LADVVTDQKYRLDIVKPHGILNHMVLDRSPKLDRVFHALAHPARRAIIRQLAGGERNLSELASPLWMTFPAATKHVRVGGQGGQEGSVRSCVVRVDALSRTQSGSHARNGITMWSLIVRLKRRIV